MVNIVKYRYYFFALSLLIIVPGFIAVLIWGIPLGIDFTGGSMLYIRFDSGALPASQDVIEIYDQFGYPDTIVQTSKDMTMFIRSKDMDEASRSKIIQAMEEQFNTTIVVESFETVGPVIGKEIALRAAEAVGLAALGILLYITYAFRGVKNAVRYGVSAIIAMLHDILVVLGFEAILGHFLGWEADAIFLTALLTIIGFSVHDTIVVFDRIRENSSISRRLPFETIVNQSIVQTFARSINTQLTVLITLLALAIFGGITIRHFVIIMIIGVLSGTYSSIFNASPILVVWEKREWRNWFHKNPAKA